MTADTSALLATLRLGTRIAPPRQGSVAFHALGVCRLQ
jgi:hypothetical protein